jgi:hypothetical protein
VAVRRRATAEPGPGSLQVHPHALHSINERQLPANNSDFNTNSDVLVFDNDGINESEADFNAQGLYDKFAIRWETYLRIPETGNYVFRTTTDDGTKLTVRRNNSTGDALGSFNYWTINPATSHSTGQISSDERRCGVAPV